MFRNLNEIIEKAGKINTQKIIIVGAEEEKLLKATKKASSLGYIEPILVGNKDKIVEIIEKNNINFPSMTIIDAETNEEKSNISCEELYKHKDSFMMKGLVDTSDVLKAILKRKKDFMVSNLISHISLIELPYYEKIIGLSDTSVNIKPDLNGKIDIVKNSRDFFNKLGYELPKISILSAIEKVNNKMQDTIDADYIKKLNQSGELNKCIIEGPISLDLSIDKKSAEIKKYDGLIKGDADILITPDLVSGNLLGKSFNYTPNSKFAGFIVGTKKPIGLTSRASSIENKLYSMIIGAIISARDDDERKKDIINN